MTFLLTEQVLSFEDEGSVGADTFKLLNLLLKKNKAVYNHSQQVANYATSTAAVMRLPASDIQHIKIASLLHDIGKLAVANAIIDKRPYLSTREQSEYKRHCNMGASMLENLPGFQNIIPLIRYHHERWDGKGFPKRLKGVNIPLGARIISVADYYDSYINPCVRNWQKSTKLGLQEVAERAGIDFDPEVVKAFTLALNN